MYDLSDYANTITAVDQLMKLNLRVREMKAQFFDGTNLIRIYRHTKLTEFMVKIFADELQRDSAQNYYIFTLSDNNSID